MPRPPDPKSKSHQLIVQAKSGEEDKIRAFKEICAKNSIHYRKVLMSAVDRFLQEHRYPPGNSQTVLIQPQCWRCKQRYPWLYKIEFISGIVRGLCERCKRKEEAKKGLSTIKRVLGKIT